MFCTNSNIVTDRRKSIIYLHQSYIITLASAQHKTQTQKNSGVWKITREECQLKAVVGSTREKSWSRSGGWKYPFLGASLFIPKEKGFFFGGGGGANAAGIRQSQRSGVEQRPLVSFSPPFMLAMKL